MTPKLVYVSGPISIGPIEHNLREALEIGEFIRALGHGAIVPHLDILWQFVNPHTWEENLAHDEIILSRCDALYRVPGLSEGADREVRYAEKLPIPVYHYMNDLRNYLQGHNNGTT